MSPREQELSFEKDMEVLTGLGDSQVQEIVMLLNRKRPTKAEIRKNAPGGFLRLLLVYAKLLETTDVSDETKRAATPLSNWFEEKIPDVRSLPGYDAFLKQCEEAMGPATVSIPSASTDSRRNISESMGVVNVFNAIPFLAGEDLTPSLRVFLMNRDHVLFDSSGDWDDWLYVVKCLLLSLEKQSESLAKSPDSWKGVPWEKAIEHLRDIKRALRSFDKRIRDNAPSDVKVPGRRKKK